MPVLLAIIHWEVLMNARSVQLGTTALLEAPRLGSAPLALIVVLVLLYVPKFLRAIIALMLLPLLTLNALSAPTLVELRLHAPTAPLGMRVPLAAPAPVRWGLRVPLVAIVLPRLHGFTLLVQWDAME